MFDKVYNRMGIGSYKWDTTVPDGLIERGAYPLSVVILAVSLKRVPKEKNIDISGQSKTKKQRGMTFYEKNFEQNKSCR